MTATELSGVTIRPECVKWILPEKGSSHVIMVMNTAASNGAMVMPRPTLVTTPPDHDFSAAVMRLRTGPRGNPHLPIVRRKIKTPHVVVVIG